MKNKILLLLICGFLLPSLSYAQSWTLIGNTSGGLSLSLPSGGPGNYNTGIGQVVLNSLQYGSNNSAFGQGSLESIVGANDYSDANNNSAFGQGTLFYNQSGNDNSAFGFQAQYKSLASYNDAFGSQALYNNVYGFGNVAIGYEAIYTSSSSYDNTAVGSQALYYNLGQYNDAVGYQALYSAASGGSEYEDYNDAMGYQALYSDADGGQGNQAVGYMTLSYNTSGSYNTGLGFAALGLNTIADYDIGIGYYALGANTTASNNIGIGYQSLYNQNFNNSNTAYSTYNIAIGDNALYSNNPTSTSNGINNTAIGMNALYTNSTGIENVAVGNSALLLNSTGEKNTAVGSGALYYGTGSDNVGIGNAADYDDVSGTENVMVGSYAGGSNTNSYNTFVGFSAGYQTGYAQSGQNNSFFGNETGIINTSGSNNSEFGEAAGSSNETGSNNVLIGVQAGYETNSDGNTFVGFYAGWDNAPGGHGVGGTYNTTLGYGSDINGAGLTNATAIGYEALALASNSIVLGNSAVTELEFNGALAPSTGSYSYDPGAAGDFLQSTGAGTPPQWVTPPSGISGAWYLTGNTGTTYGTNFLGTTDDNNLMFQVDGQVAGRIEDATSGSSNTSLGYGALASAGSDNTAVGYWSLAVPGRDNIAIGYNAAVTQYRGSSYNIAIGEYTLSNNHSSDNIAIGNQALTANTYSSQNTSIGYQALYNQSYNGGGTTYTSDNVAVGYQALYNTDPTGASGGVATSGYLNTAVGDLAGATNEDGYENTFLGEGADVGSTGLADATAIGYGAKVTSGDAMEFGTCDVTFTGLNGGTYSASKALVVGCGSGNTNGNGAYMDLSGVWYPGSSIKIKDHITTMDGKDILNKICMLNVKRWTYKGTNVFHIGPFAEQFYDFFNTGLDSLHISYVDPSGVALIGIQQLNKNQNATDSTIAQQQQQISDLQFLKTADEAQLANQQSQLTNQQSQLDQLSAMVSKMDIALSQCCTNYQSTTIGLSQTGSNNNDAPLLNQNIPNPFTQNTIISCYVPTTAKGASISIFDLNGQLLKSFTIPATGFNQVTISGGTLAAGDYLYTLFVDGAKIDTKKMTLTH